MSSYSAAILLLLMSPCALSLTTWMPQAISAANQSICFKSKCKQKEKPLVAAIPNCGEQQASAKSCYNGEIPVKKVNPVERDPIDYTRWCDTDDGKYIKTKLSCLKPFSCQLSTWTAATEECCKRGGQLVDFHDSVFAKATEKEIALENGKSFWVRAQVNRTANDTAEWCVQDEAVVKMQPQPLTAAIVVDDNFVTMSSTRDNCICFIAADSYAIIDCTAKMPFMCLLHIRFPYSRYNAVGNMFDPISKKYSTCPVINGTDDDAPNAIAAEREPGKPFYFKCGAKRYMGVMEEFPRLDAFYQCYGFGLQMLSVDKVSELKCILNFFKGTVSSSYWTSGMNFGTENTTTYGWCSTGKLVSRKMWAQDEPMDPDTNRCLALTVMEDEPTLSGMEAVHCTLLLPLICQFPRF